MGKMFAAVVLATVPSFGAAESYPSAAEFAATARVGNAYSCINPNGNALFFQIGKITTLGKKIKVYHIQITPVNDGDVPMMHGPFAAESFTYCLLDPEAKELGYVRFDRSAFNGGFREWKKAKGGVFTIDVTEIFNLIRKTMQ